MRRHALLATAATSLPAIVAGCTSSSRVSGSNAVAEAATARLEVNKRPLRGVGAITIEV